MMENCKHKYPDVLLIGDYDDGLPFFIRLYHCKECGIYGKRQNLNDYHSSVLNLGELKTTNEIQKVRKEIKEKHCGGKKQ